MERRAVPQKSMIPLRALPRFFFAGWDPEVESFEIPTDELDKIRKVLRLSTGAEIAALPGDGRTILRGRLEGRSMVITQRLTLDTEPTRRITLAQALPKGDKLDDIIRMATEVGVHAFLLFPSERSVVRWDPKKMEGKLRRYRAIATEASEVSFRAAVPKIEVMASLGDVLRARPQAWVLSETEGVSRSMDAILSEDLTLVIGPEGGWAPREVTEIADRAVTLGPRVLRAETAAVAAVTLALLGSK
jgi:16S rRNA (uracil1498-N3)-methyltransferase